MTEQEEQEEQSDGSVKILAQFCSLWRSPPPFCLPSLLPSACTFRGLCLSASSSSTLNTAEPWAPSIKGPDHPESRGLVWNVAYSGCFAPSDTSIYIYYPLQGNRSAFLFLCLLLYIISFHPDGLFGTGGLPGWILVHKIPLNRAGHWDLSSSQAQWYRFRSPSLWPRSKSHRCFPRVPVCSVSMVMQCTVLGLMHYGNEHINSLPHTHSDVLYWMPCSSFQRLMQRCKMETHTGLLTLLNIIAVGFSSIQNIRIIRNILLWCVMLWLTTLGCID